MKRLATLLLCVAAPAVFFLLAASPAGASEPDAARKLQLDSLLNQDCGSCHGMTLKGGLGSPLTLDAMRAQDDDTLLYTILEGRPGTPMPPWKMMLSEADARWLVRRLKGDVP
ncbi:MAG: cytochrome c [Magnetospirillum sp.]|nr:cytochrome c [Magnetospirillum sp.]